MAKILYDLLSTNSKKLNRRNCNGLTDSSTLQIAKDPKLILKIIPEQVVTKKLGSFSSRNHSIQS
jgi:hypothetical protein